MHGPCALGCSLGCSCIHREYFLNYHATSLANRAIFADCCAQPAQGGHPTLVAGSIFVRYAAAALNVQMPAAAGRA
eukprot:scaffold14932_cov133-Isochrysis_galbana.AAC.4